MRLEIINMLLLYGFLSEFLREVLPLVMMVLIHGACNYLYPSVGYIFMAGNEDVIIKACTFTVLWTLRYRILVKVCLLAANWAAR